MSEVSNQHSTNIFWIPVDVATDLLYTGANTVSSVLKGTGHTLAEGVRDITGDQTAFGGDPADATHRRNVLWLPVDAITGALTTGASVLHHVVTGVANSAVDTANDVVETVK